MIRGVGGGGVVSGGITFTVLGGGGIGRRAGGAGRGGGGNSTEAAIESCSVKSGTAIVASSEGAASTIGTGFATTGFGGGSAGGTNARGFFWNKHPLVVSVAASQSVASHGVVLAEEPGISNGELAMPDQ